MVSSKYFCCESSLEQELDGGDLDGSLVGQRDHVGELLVRRDERCSATRNGRRETYGVRHPGVELVLGEHVLVPVGRGVQLVRGGDPRGAGGGGARFTCREYV